MVALQGYRIERRILHGEMSTIACRVSGTDCAFFIESPLPFQPQEDTAVTTDILRSLLAFGLAATLALGCAEESELLDSPTGPTALTVSPDRGCSASVVSLAGMDPARLEGEGLRLIVHGVETNLTVLADGTLLASIPVFLDEEGSIAPVPTQPVGFELYSGEELIGEAASAFTVEELPEAPGAADRVVELFDSIAADLRSIGGALAAEPSVEHAYATAFAEALDELLSGEDERSLLGQLEGLERGTDGALEFVEGILAGSGLLARMEEVAEGVAAVGTQTEAIAAASARKSTTLDQHDLAARMQLHVMVHDFGQTVIGDTAATWSQWVGTFVGGIAFVGVTGTVLAPGIAVGGAVGLVLGLANFAINDVALAYLPARVDDFELRVEEPVVAPGEVADTEIWVEASNEPAPITVLELVDLVLNAMGLVPGQTPSGHPTRVALIQTIDYFLGVARNVLSQYASIYPDVDLAYDAASIPSMSWRARITDTRYVEPLTQTPELIAPADDDILAWRAQLDVEGEGRVHARMQSGPEVTSLPQIPGYTYQAGAFGEDLRSTQTETIVVAPPLIVTASMDTLISPGGVNGLEIRAGSRDSVGDIVWREGLDVVLTAVGGTVDPAEGQTAPDGRFDTFVRLDEGSSEVTVDAVVSDELGVEGSASITARTEAESLVVDARLASTIDPAEPERLRVDVHRDVAGELVEEPFADVRLTVTGGSADELTGSADEEGYWSTFVSVDAEAEQVVVLVEVTTGDGLEGEATATAHNLDALPIRVLSHSGRAWLNTSGTGGPNWSLYTDNFHDLRAPSIVVDWTYSSNGEKDGKTCEVTTSLGHDSQLIYDQATGLLSRWESTSEMSSEGSASALTEFNNPNCGGNTQVQARLRFRINEGSWRVSWSLEQQGESYEAHPNWECEGIFRDAEDEQFLAPPTSIVEGEVVLGPGDHDFWVNPTMTANTNASGTDGNYLASGGHSIAVDFERVDAGAGSR